MLGMVLTHYGYSPIQSWPTVCALTNKLNANYARITKGKNSMIFDADRMPWGLQVTCGLNGCLL
jgi:hypothetical protein